MLRSRKDKKLPKIYTNFLEIEIFAKSPNSSFIRFNPKVWVAFE